MPDENGFLTWADFAGTAPDYEGVVIKITDADRLYVSINGQWKQIKSLAELPKKANQVEGVTKVELEKMYPEAERMAQRGVKADMFLLILLTRCKPISIEPPAQHEEHLPEFLKPQADTRGNSETDSGVQHRSH